MALSRRTGQRFQSSIWPGFVDAMTGLLLVLMFVLTIFMVVQFVLRETISGQETELNTLSGEVARLAQALGLEQRKSKGLETKVGELSTTLSTAQDEARRQAAVIVGLQAAGRAKDAEIARANSQIKSFEAQVAGLLADRADRDRTIAGLKAREEKLLSDQQALNLALAKARTEVDAGKEAARLAAAKREALEALIAGLKKDKAGLTQRLSDEEKGKLAEAAAAEALRKKLKSADAELTAITLALEAERKKAAETLTLLAAEEKAKDDLDLRLAAALLADDKAKAAARDQAARVADLEARLKAAKGAGDKARGEAAGLTARVAALEAELKAATGVGDKARGEVVSLTARIAALEAELSKSKDAAGANAASKAALAKQLQLAQAELAKARRMAAATEVNRGREADDLRARLTAALAAQSKAGDAAKAADVDRAKLRDQLRQALAAKLKAEAAAQKALSDAEARRVLLATARDALKGAEGKTAEAVKQQALLNQQVASLRGQLGSLQAILDDYKARDAASKVQVQNLGKDLNAALARAAAEKDRRLRLEEAERKRLEEEKKKLQAEAKDLEKYRSEFFGRMRDAIGNREGVRIVGDRFVFSSEVLFPPGGATLSAEGRVQIARVAKLLQDVARDIPAGIDWVIQVDGHTDNQPLSGFGAYKDNWELSQARALSVVRYMAGSLAVPPGRLSANGFGEFQPLAPGDSAAARAQNRRIELKLTER